MYQTGGTIKETLEAIQQAKYVLPAIQREFVWKPEQIARLFDSLMPSYPFGNFLNPSLNDDDFAAAVRTAQAEYDQHRPDVIVGSSRGGAVAMNIDSGDTPLVLLCPAWKNWGTVTKLKPNTTILHSRKDDVIPFADSEELINNSNLPPETLIEVGNDHRLADPEPLKAMLEACERLRMKANQP